MLQLVDIKKDYTTGDSTVHALRGVSIEFRESEFVSILGQSGCGKTTLLNIIGGLDKYSSGDLIINGVSTKKYKDADWDTYRNHSIGFVFQSYNLIPHQNVLANVELALTLSGVGKAERKKRAIEALERVGLGDQINKRPNQLSGGQMQRVAIARALVNNPDILLADEPTGALDSETSVQVMDILKEIAKDKLVIMVTHNPELADEYSTRIIRLLDGEVVSDSNPYTAPADAQVAVEPAQDAEALAQTAECDSQDGKAKKKKKKRSMSFFTALSLSLHNLMTKKGRTFLTAFAGSIGIIGIALILSVSTGVNSYIDSVEESTMASYPITINKTSIDLTTLIGSVMGDDEGKEIAQDKVYSNDILTKVMMNITNGLSENNLEAFKNYIETDPDQTIVNNSTDIKYQYIAKLNTYYKNENGQYKKTLDGFTELIKEIKLDSFMGESAANSMDMMGGSAWTELVGSNEYIESQYNKIAGKLPEPGSTNEVILIVDENQQVTDYILYLLGILSTDDLRDWVVQLPQNMINGTVPEITPNAEINVNDLLGLEYAFVPEAELYKLDENGMIVKKDPSEIDFDKAVKVTICGIYAPKQGSMVLGSIGYTSALMTELVNRSNATDVVNAQLTNTQTNLITGIDFDYAPDFSFFDPFLQMSGYEPTQLSNVQKASALKGMLGTQFSEIISKKVGPFTADDLATIKPFFTQNPVIGTAFANESDENILKIANTMLTNSSHEQVLAEIGYVDFNKPNSILIYPKDFDAKETINNDIKNNYNANRGEDEQIKYSDMVAALMGSITTIVDAITYVLIAFVSISLIVSSIMIGIITYISVLERTKEIGVLRAVGASKRDVSRVFNAETLIVGFIAGVIGILITLGLVVIINIILFSLTELETLKAKLPFLSALILIAISMFLTFIAGLIPSRIASKKDPVIALRSE